MVILLILSNPIISSCVTLVVIYIIRKNFNFISTIFSNCTVVSSKNQQMYGGNVGKFVSNQPLLLIRRIILLSKIIRYITAFVNVQTTRYSYLFVFIL